MPPRKELSPQVRARICELRSLVWGPKRIYSKHPEIPFETIRSTIRRGTLGEDRTSKPSSGRPRALTEEQRDHVYDVVNHTNPHIKMRDLLREVDDACKKRRMQSLLRSMDKKKWLQRKRPFITPAHAKARLDWAIRHQAYTLNDWMKVSWSDECKGSIQRGLLFVLEIRFEKEIFSRFDAPLGDKGGGSDFLHPMFQHRFAKTAVAC